MSAEEWLAVWEPIAAPGRHSRMIPADGACGYPAPYHGQILRCIQVTGTVKSAPSWEKSPQACFWLEKGKPGIWDRFKAWLKKGGA